MAPQTIKIHYSGSKEVFHKKSIKNPNIEADFLFYKFFYTFCIRGSQDVQLVLKVNIDLHGTENVLKKRYTSSKEVPYEKSIENPNLEATSPFYRIFNRFCNRYCYTDTAFHATENILNNIIKDQKKLKLIGKEKLKNFPSYSLVLLCSSATVFLNMHYYEKEKD